jgi:DNA-binding NtrC family response regulator
MVLESAQVLKRPPRMFDEDHLVICIDDEPETLRALLRLFRGEPFEVLTTRVPEETIQWVQKWDVSLVIADQRMPFMTGLELLKEVGRYSPTTICVILTGYPDSNLATECTRHDVRRIITKPWDDASLKQTVYDLLHRKDLEDLERHYS